MIQIQREGIKARAIAIKTQSSEDLENRCWSGTNAPYFSLDAIEWITANFSHLLCDLPSVDREDDGGHLSVHRIFFGLPKEKDPPSDLIRATVRSHSTITELCCFPDSLQEGLYGLSLQISPLDLDAAPSRPVFFVLRP